MAKFLKQADNTDIIEEDIAGRAAEIINNIKETGDEALIRYNKTFDDYKGNLRLTDDQIKKAYSEVDNAVLDDLKFAADNIRSFAAKQKQMFGDMEMEGLPGVQLGHRVIAVESCGCYVPGGRYPLPSSALMSIIPAKVAGVRSIAACSPKSGGWESIHPAVIAAMDIAGADEIFCMGGAQAIGAFAYGTETVKEVSLIVGPGNQYVTEAKRQVYGKVNIDFTAGPSEVLIIADETGNGDFIAADILAQSEHDPQASGILLCTSETLANEVIEKVMFYGNTIATKGIALAAWKKNGRVILCESLSEAAEIANSIAPEHLEIQVKEPEALITSLYNYGSLFIGPYSGEVFGDYVSGTNHILPTVKAAKYTGGVWVGTFLKVATYQRITAAGIREIGGAASRLAETEGLFAHKLAADLRIKDIGVNIR